MTIDFYVICEDTLTFSEFNFFRIGNQFNYVGSNATSYEKCCKDIASYCKN